MAKRILYPPPTCPLCKATMVLREPKPDDEWPAFWGCSRFPKCRGTRNINPDTGKPETDFEIDERLDRRLREELDDIAGGIDRWGNDD